MNYDECVLTVIALYFSFFLSAAVLSSEKCKSCKSYVQDGNFETADQRTGLCVHVHNVQSHILYVNICQSICVYICHFCHFAVAAWVMLGSCTLAIVLHE